MPRGWDPSAPVWGGEAAGPPAWAQQHRWPSQRALQRGNAYRAWSPGLEASAGAALPPPGRRQPALGNLAEEAVRIEVPEEGPIAGEQAAEPSSTKQQER